MKVQLIWASSPKHQTNLVAGDEVAVDRVVMDDSAAELGGVCVGVLEDDTGWIDCSWSFGTSIDGLTV
jgi:hypothetical protein